MVLPITGRSPDRGAIGTLSWEIWEGRVVLLKTSKTILFETARVKRVSNRLHVFLSVSINQVPKLSTGEHYIFGSIVVLTPLASTSGRSNSRRLSDMLLFVSSGAVQFLMQ